MQSLEEKDDQKVKEEEEYVKAYILTNGYLETGYNYVKLFRSKTKAINYARDNYVNLKYDYYEIQVLKDAMQINIMVTRDGINDYTIAVAGSELDFYKHTLEYYKQMYKDLSEGSSHVSVKSTLRVKNGHTVLQAFSPSDGYNSFSWIGPLSYS
jgi:hypothetical protein